MPLDADAMHAAAQFALGKHDFSTFRAAECQAKSPVKTLDRLDRLAPRRHDRRHRQRAQLPPPSGALDGGLAEARGRGPLVAADFRDALDAADRSRCGPMAPPDGLYLVRVDY